MSCKVCHRKAGARNFCPSHLKAYENIVEKYDFWRKALKTSWKDYIREIEKNSLTGECTKEVAKYLTNNEEAKNVTES